MGKMNAHRILFSAALMALSSCYIEAIEDAGSARFNEDFHQEHPMPPGGRLSVENVNGPVEITGWDQDRIEINGTKYASTKEALSRMKVETHNTSGMFEIRTVGPEGWSSRMNGGVRYRIRVPRKTRLERIQSTNGSLTAASIEGPVKMRTTNGAIKLDDVKGEAEAVSTNGSIRATGVHGRFAASTTNGSVDLTAEDLEPGASNRIKSTNGSLNLTLRSAKINDIDASTTNGAISLRMPAAVNVRLRASTSSGRISTDFPVDKLIDSRRRHLDASLGTGGPLMELRTTNGGIRIEKY